MRRRNFLGAGLAALAAVLGGAAVWLRPATKPTLSTHDPANNPHAALTLADIQEARVRLRKQMFGLWKLRQHVAITNHN